VFLGGVDSSIRLLLDHTYEGLCIEHSRKICISNLEKALARL